jgi:3-methyladenine DNA glycosylase AlkD
MLDPVGEHHADELTQGAEGDAEGVAGGQDRSHPGELETAPPVVDAVRAALALAGDPARAAAQQAYMKSQLPYRGITSPELRAILRPIFADPELQLRDRAAWERAVRTLWDEATHREELYAAIALTGHRDYRGWQDPQALTLYRYLVTTGAWWDLVDEVAGNRVGPILQAHSEVVTPLVRQWSRDEDLWLRRTAIICQLGLREQTDVALLQDVIEPNLADRSFWIRKAIGWALRQYARTDPQWVLAAVTAYGDRLSGLSRREAMKHL